MKTFLKSATSTAGFLEGCSVEFAEGLNCVIGARGTCKSTLIESIRFAFDCDQERVAQMLNTASNDRGNQRNGLIDATLRGGTVQCCVLRKNADGLDTYTLEREALPVQPRVYHDGVRLHTENGILPHIEIYSQGDLQLLAENERERLSLVDRPNKVQIKKFVEERKVLAEQLTILGIKLRDLRQQIEKYRQEVKVLPGTESQLDLLRRDRPQLSAEMEQYRMQYEQRARSLSLMKTCIPIVHQAHEAAYAMQQPVNQLSNIRQQLEAFHEPECNQAIGLLAKIEALLHQVIAIGDSIPTQELTDLINQAESAFDARNEAYYRLRQQEQDANDSLKQEEILQSQVQHLLMRKSELDILLANEIDLLQERQTLRDQVANAGENIRRFRMMEIDSINTEHGQTILLSLSPSNPSTEYIDAVLGILSGSRIREQDQIARDLAGLFTPTELIDIVEGGDANSLAEALSRDLGQMTRVIAHLSDHEKLYELEACLPEDRLEITMYDGGIPKPVESLSKGQKATALLPLILRPLPYPLIFDQPEDDLDNSFIFRSLVRTISQLKQHRQLIFVTHNANIPVLGDADQVIVMHMETPTHAAPPLSGTVDERKRDILDLMEGGAQAFEERERRYRPLLGSHEE